MPEEAKGRQRMQRKSKETKGSQMRPTEATGGKKKQKQSRAKRMDAEGCQRIIGEAGSKGGELGSSNLAAGSEVGAAASRKWAAGRE